MWLKNLLLLIGLFCLITVTFGNPRYDDDDDDYDAGEDRGHHKKKKRRRRPCSGRDYRGNGKDANGKTIFDWNLYYSDVSYNYNHNYNINCGGSGGNNQPYKPTLTAQQASHPLITHLTGHFGNGGGGIIPPGGIGNFQGLFSNVGQSLGSGIQSVVAGGGGGGSGGGFGSGLGFGSILGSPATGGNGGVPAGGSGGLGFFGQNGLFDFMGGWLNAQRPPTVVPNRPIPNDPISPAIVGPSDDVVHDVPNDPVIEDKPVYENYDDNVPANGNQYWKPGQYVGAYNPAIGGYYQNLSNIKPNKVIHKFNREFNKLARPFYDLFFRR